MEKQKEKIPLKQRKKQEKGITLIALVITIIVLLILAAVSISTLTGQNGILTRASDANRENEIASVKEQAQLDISNWIAGELENGREGIVDNWEDIEIILNMANPDVENRYYKNVTEEGVETPNGYLVPIEELYINNTGGEETESKTVEDLVVGDRVYYNTGNPSVGENGIIECVVLYDTAYNEANGTDYGVQIISKDIVDNVTLGDDDNFEESKDSYNNALKILYDKAQGYLNPTYASGARCVGSDPADPDWDTTTNEAGYYTRQVAEQKDEYRDFMENGGWYNNVFKNADEKYDIDLMQIENIAGLGAASGDYWLASRDITFNSRSGNFEFIIYMMDSSGEMDYANLDSICSVGQEFGMRESSQIYGFRPVITLKPGTKIVEGNEENTPYTLAT